MDMDSPQDRHTSQVERSTSREDMEETSAPIQHESNTPKLRGDDERRRSNRSRSHSRSPSRHRQRHRQRQRSHSRGRSNSHSRSRSRSRSVSPSRPTRSSGSDRHLSRSPPRSSVKRMPSSSRRHRLRSRSRSPRSHRHRRSPSRDRKPRHHTSLSRSQSFSPRRQRPSVRRPRSPSMEEHRLKKERELHGTRESPEISKVIGVFGLSLRTGKEDLESMFTKFGPLEKSVIVYDHRSGRSRGFGFVYFEDQHHATDAREAMNGAEIDNRKIRVDYSTTHRPHTPTPGAYMGEKLRNDTRRYQRRYSPARSPVRRRSYGRRSRSRSWSR